MRRHGWSVRALGAHQLDARGLPSWMTFTRGAGSWSRQTAPAVNGTTFIELGTAQNTPRFDYDPTSGRPMLLVEPTRMNEAQYGQIVDTGIDDVPDGFVLANGTAGVDFNAVNSVGPHGGWIFRIEDTAVVTRGCVATIGYTDNVAMVWSAWVRRSGTAGGAGDTLRGWESAGGRRDLTLSAGPHDWARYQVGPHTSGIGGGGVTDFYYLQSQGDPTGVVDQALLQLEQGDCASSVIPTPAGAAVTRAAELCAIDPSVVGRSSGSVSLLWRPDFASTTALTVDPTLFAWAPNWELLYDPADDKLKVMVNGTKRAASAALSFARQALLRVTVRYSSAGQQLTVIGGGVSAAYTDATSWGTPTLAPYLGSRAASANCRPSAYGDLLLAA